MDKEALKKDLGDELCQFCPWKNGDIPHTCDSLCEGNHCDEALDNFLDENEGLFDEQINN